MKEISKCCWIQPEKRARLEVIEVYVMKLLEEKKTPHEIAIEEGVSEDEVRKAFSEITEITGNKEAMKVVNETIAKMDAT